MENNPYNLGDPKNFKVGIKWETTKEKWRFTVGCPQYVFFLDDVQKGLDYLKEYYANPTKFVEDHKINLGNKNLS